MDRIPLTRGQSAIVDAEDYEWLIKFKWQAKWCSTTKSFYAARSLPRDKTGKRLAVMMHREIMGAQDGVEVDHRNHDTLDNRKSELRFASHAQNLWNTRVRRNNKCGFKGVIQRSATRWSARITINGKRRNLGHFRTPEEASRAYDRAAIEFYGAFAYQYV